MPDNSQAIPDSEDSSPHDGITPTLTTATTCSRAIVSLPNFAASGARRADRGALGMRCSSARTRTLITRSTSMRFGQLLRPAIEVWEDFASTCWSLVSQVGRTRSINWKHDTPSCAGSSRHSRPRLTSPYRKLCEAGRGHDWLFEQRGLVMSIAISLEEGASEVTTRDGRLLRGYVASAFVALRKIVDTHRRLWLEGHIDRMLDVMWRTDVGTAAGAYWTRFRGKGASPTIKQALPDVLGAAERWFNADYGALARLTGLSGPIAQSPTATRRQRPGNLPGLRCEVAAVLRASSARECA